VIITPAYLPTDEGTLQKIYRELSKLIDIPVNRGEITDESVKTFNIVITILEFPRSFISAIPTHRIPGQENAILMKNSFDHPGETIGLARSRCRDNPCARISDRSLTSEVIGFLGPIPAALEASMKEKGFVPGRDKYGYAGVENSLNEILMGQNGKRTIEVDVAGKEIRNITNPIAPVPGNNVKLTIDVRLQNAAKTALISEINFWNTYLNRIQSANGVVIALNPKTGEILALVSYPTYENNRMARFIPAYYYNQISNDPNRPLFNHAVSAEHSPGSVFKMVTAIGALNEGVVTPDKELEDLGKITIMQKFTENEVGIPRDYVCHLATGHGMVNFLKGVAQSCNVYFYKLGGGYQNEVPKGLGIWRIGEYARALGYGAISGVELPGESTGLIPDPTWKRINLGENWATGDTYIATVGQGYVLATPIQVVMSAATIGNNGKLMQPTLVREITDKDGDVVKPFEPKMKWDLTVDPKIQVFDEDFLPTGEMKTIEPWCCKWQKKECAKLFEMVPRPKNS
jgi:penicillin-binding protein 2